MKKFLSAVLIPVCLVSSLSGCASIVSGKRQDVNIRSTPAGADVLIDGSVGGTTPMIANLVRKDRHTIELKKEGYTTVTKATTRGFNWWYLGNLILGGIIGLIIDPCTGAMFTVKPKDIYVDFKTGEVTTDKDTKPKAAAAKP
jgi:hypothetical protein